MGRHVFDAIFRPPRRDVTDMFLPRRTAFVYDMEGGETLDIPTTLHRSKADCPKVKKNIASLPLDTRAALSMLATCTLVQYAASLRRWLLNT